MKWVVVASFFVCFATLSKASAPSCQPGSDDAQCVSENTEKVSESIEPSDDDRERKKHLKAECSAGSEWESKCHKCRCSEQGRAECTRMDVCEKGDYGDPIRCKPRTTFKVECNTCSCLESGLTLCTLIGCLSSLPDLPVLPEPSTTKAPSNGKRKDCLPGSRWKSKCNECFCTEDGLPACTEMACPGREDEREMRCAPNTTWMNDCNRCWCHGGTASCTRMGCHAFMVADFNPIGAQTKPEEGQPEMGADHIERHSVCKPRGTFYIGCNTCHCSVDGLDFTCTNKPCPLPKDVEVFHELRAVRTAAKDVVCPANRMFIKDCNTCWCNEDGTSFFCTRKVCITELPDEIIEEQPENVQELKRKCRPDEVFEMDCNTCHCNSDGSSFSCTRRACVPEEKAKNVSLNRRVRATAQEPPKQCQPGMEFRMDCNKCLCDNEGQNYSCTRIDCAALNSNGNGGARRKRETAQVQTQCVPESVFNQDCNVCRCEADGTHATCTVKRCKQDKPDEEDGTDLSPDSDLSFRCNPGEQFKRGCNDCTCSADGRSVFCTIRLCDQDITPTM